MNHFWTTVCRTVRPMLSDRCPVLSVTLVYYGQTVGWIKMKLGVQVGLGPGHILFDGDPGPPPPKGHSPPNFRPISVPAKWLHGEDATWYGGRPRLRRLSVRWGARSPSAKTGRSPQIFGHVHCGQTAEWIKMALDTEVGLNPGDIVLDGDPAPFPKKGAEPPPQFSAHFYCRQTAGCINMSRPTECRYCRYPATKGGCHGNHFSAFSGV